jgi:hypothetical protein
MEISHYRVYIGTKSSQRDWSGERSRKAIGQYFVHVTVLTYRQLSFELKASPRTCGILML